MKKFIRITLYSSLLIFVACASGNCRNRRISNEPVKPKAGVPVKAQEGRVLVYKYDGSLQCGMGTGKAVKEMSKELINIKIYSSENKSDGLMHIQMCGSATGQANVYEISAKDQAKAESLGFKVWNF